MIGVTRDGNVLTLEMQRPERRNALNAALVDGVREEIEKASPADTRAIVLTGQGTVFSAGADLSDAEGVARELPDKALALNLAIDASPIPIIAALNGPAIGAGVILAMICDLFDPDVIVLAGGMSNLETLYGRLPGAIAPHVFTDTFATPVRRALHGDSSGVRGAAWLWEPAG